MDAIEALALFGCLAALIWVVLEIAWRDPRAFAEIAEDAERFARAPAEARETPAREAPRPPDLLLPERRLPT